MNGTYGQSLPRQLPCELRAVDSGERTGRSTVIDGGLEILRCSSRPIATPRPYTTGLARYDGQKFLLGRLMIR
jgi:hypothetical protein